MSGVVFANETELRAETDRLLRALEELLTAEKLGLHAGDVVAAAGVSARVFPVLKALAHALQEYPDGRDLFCDRIARVQRVRRENQQTLKTLKAEREAAYVRVQEAKRRLRTATPYAAPRRRSTFAAAG